MCASPLKLLRAGPPPPKVAILSDAVFFTRAVPIAPEATAAEVASQVEIALEALSPFPLAQLYHGYFWTPAATHALIFAAYRRRFTAEQTDLWADAELVLPAFATVLGHAVTPATMPAYLSLVSGLSLVSRSMMASVSPDAFTNAG